MPAPDPLPSLSDLKRRLNITSSRDDSELALTLGDAAAIIEGRIGPLAPTTVVETHVGGRGALVLRRLPVVEVTGVVYDNLSTVDPLDLVVEPTGVLRWGYGTAGWFSAGRVTVTYTAGYASLPHDLRRAVLELAAHLWRSQRGNAPSVFNQAEGETPSPAYLLPYSVQSLLEPYLPPSVA